MNSTKKFILVTLCLFSLVGILWAADIKISALTAKSAPVAADTTIIVDSVGGANKKITLGTIPLNPTNEATDTTCFPVFTTAATGDLGPKTNTGLTYNSNLNSLGCTTFVGTASGNPSNIVSSNPTTGNYTPFLSADVRTVGPAAGISLYQLVYQTGTASTVDLAKADSATTMRCIGMAVSSGTIAQGAPVTILSDGLITNSGWSWTPGAELYVDPSTAGVITATKPSAVGQQVQAVARAKTATTIRMLTNQSLLEIGTGPLSYSAYGTGVVYALTNAAALLNMGTTPPSITLVQAGTYLINAQANFLFNAATFAANRVITIKVRRTNNTAADIATAPVLTTPIITTLTYTFGVFPIPSFVYAATAGDIIEVWSFIDTVPSAGSVDTVGASIIATKIN